MSAESADLLRIAAAVSDGQAVDWDLESRRTGADVRSVTGLRDIERIVQACRSAASDDQIDEATQTLGDPRVGTRLDVEGPSAERWGPLQRLRPIGRGAFGTVYRAWDSRLEREVALKLFRVSPSRGTPTVEEGRLLARVRHANVVTVYGAEEHDGWIGIWMELIDGRSLDSVLTDHGPFAPRETALIGIELCHALAAVHRAGLVHGDVKAQNVMRETGGRIVLTDFGAGREGSAETASATLSGTPLYMAPELLTGGHPSAATDLYALGVLLFYLLSGEHPVTAQNLLELRSAHERGERKRLRDVRPDVSPAIARVVERAINPDPAARYSTAGAFEEALAEAMSEKAASVDRGVRRLFGVARFRWSVMATVGAGLAVYLIFLVGSRPRFARSPSSAAMEPPPVMVPSPSPEPRATPTSTRASVTPTPTPSPRSPLRSTNVASLAPPSPGPTTVGALQPTAPPAAAEDFTIDVALYRERAGARERLLPGSRVDVGDAISLEVDGSRSLYLYVLHRDDRNQPIVLFPIPGFEPTNPLPAGPQRLPGRVGSALKDWQIDSHGGTERVLIVASATPLPDLDAVVASAPHPTAGGQPAYASVPAETADRLRGMGSIVERPSVPGKSDIFELAKSLGSQGESAKNVWMRQIDLLNPAKERP